jgi:hypothetical protein
MLFLDSLTTQYNRNQDSLKECGESKFPPSE